MRPPRAQSGWQMPVLAPCSSASVRRQAAQRREFFRSGLPWKLQGGRHVRNARTPDNGRLILVSNRLPVTVQGEGESTTIRWSVGGLATALRGPHEARKGVWIGWMGQPQPPGSTLPAPLQSRMTALGLVPVPLSPHDVNLFYESFSNGVLWPTFHNQVDRIPVHAQDWENFRAVNQRFADAVVTAYQPGDVIWVHDYQLMLVPGMIRERLPGARIGFFLHIPFPPADVFRVIPWREELLEGLLGADLIGVHTHAYLRHLSSSLMHCLPVEVDVDHVWFQGRLVALGVFPIGADAARYVELCATQAVQAEAARVRAQNQVQWLLLGVDRLDHTKGIPRRMLAVETLLKRNPSLNGKVRLVQVAVPSREGVAAYTELRTRVDALVGRINGELGTASWMPIHCLYQALSADELAALYLAADVMLVTPLKDGMNLVAKEFAAARQQDGVLVLSEFAGAAAEMGEALLTNPYDVEGTARVIEHALQLSAKERRHRMARLHHNAVTFDVHAWARGFLEALGAAAMDASRREFASPESLVAELAAVPRTSLLAVLLDYDGTLVPFSSLPELATPDAALMRLLHSLAHLPRTELHVVSGRSRDDLEAWFGGLDVGLHAEHGLWSRPYRGREWQALRLESLAWKERVRPVMQHFTQRTPGSFIEDKGASLAWHYRNADPDVGLRQARELRLHLTETLSNAPVEVLGGNKVVEVRVHGVHKGRVLEAIRAEPGVRFMAIGDDRTDEDLFRMLPPSAITVSVGTTRSRARFQIGNPMEVRELLNVLLRMRAAPLDPRDLAVPPR